MPVRIHIHVQRYLHLHLHLQPHLNLHLHQQLHLHLHLHPTSTSAYAGIRVYLHAYEDIYLIHLHVRVDMRVYICICILHSLQNPFKEVLRKLSTPGFSRKSPASQRPKRSCSARRARRPKSGELLGMPRAAKSSPLRFRRFSTFPIPKLACC